MALRNCACCSKQFEVSENQLKYSGYGQYCSRRCHYAHRTVKATGNTNTRPDGRTRVYLPGHPLAGKSGWVYKNRLTSFQATGAAPAKAEVVHHKNHNPSDDRPENLEVKSRSTHTKEHARERALARGVDPEVNRRCRVCKTIKPLGMFSPSSSRGRKTKNSACKPCAAAGQRARRKNAK